MLFPNFHHLNNRVLQTLPYVLDLCQQNVFWKIIIPGVSPADYFICRIVLKERKKIFKLRISLEEKVVTRLVDKLYRREFNLV